MIHREEHGAVAILRLAHGKASALDLELLHALEQTLANEESSPARAVVLTGTGSIFSAGVDLFRVLDGGREYLEQFLPALDASFGKLLAFEKPLVAAINGHAIAGGCILACGADRRLLARGKATYGAPELKVGVPFPPVALELLRLGFPPRHLRDAALRGRIFGVEECCELGLVDEVVEPTELLAHAIAAAEELAAFPMRAFALTKRQLRRPAIEAVERASGLAPRILDAWSSPEILGAIRAYVDRTLKR
jgi:enoyl-CoA hydratase